MRSRFASAFRHSRDRPHLTLAQPPARIHIAGSLADRGSRFAALQRRVLTLERASANSAELNPLGTLPHS